MGKVGKIVLDTNVVVAALRSSKGASHGILLEVLDGRLKAAASVSLFLEYEDVLKRSGKVPALELADIDAVLDALAQCIDLHPVFYLWRPLSPDPDDDLIVEVAVASGADYIVTANVSHFLMAKTFGLQVQTPRDFLRFYRSL